jgi:hypothetical protein
MADNTTEDPEVDPDLEAEEGSEEGSEDGPKKDKGPIKLLGGMVGLIAAGGALAFMALPGKPGEGTKFTGPYNHSLFEVQFISNVEDNNFTRFIKTNPQVEYFAYDEAYITKRVTDPGYSALLQHVFGSLVSRRNLDEIYGGTLRDQFAEEIRGAVNPILFPVHIGETDLPLEIDSDSGLRPGNSYRHTTFSGRFEDHVLKVDVNAKTIQIDDGPQTTFTGTEEDLAVLDVTGEVLYLDTTNVNSGFQGEVSVGSHGRIRQVFLSSHIAQ